MYNRILIITGGHLRTEFVKTLMMNETFDIVIAVDSGLAIVKELNMPVNYIVGDFDSVPDEVITYYKSLARVGKTITIQEFNPEKDATDTQIAIELAVSLAPNEMIILGATGTRLDHTLANIHLLNIPLQKNIKAFIIDEYNKIYMIKKNFTLNRNQLYGSYISLQPFTEIVDAITLKGFKYPLTKRDLYIGDSLGISNEVVEEKAYIELEKGILIVIESKD